MAMQQSHARLGGWVNVMQDGLLKLTEETAELGLLAEEVFKNAVSALFGDTYDIADAALVGQRQCTLAYNAIHQQALELLSRYAPSLDDMRRVVELQQMAVEFMRIAEHARAIAEHATALAGTAESQLLRATVDGPDLLMRLVRQTYIAVRGGVIVCTTRDSIRASRLLQEDGEIDRLYLVLKALLDGEISLNPRTAFPLHQLLVIVTQMEQIGNRVAAICQTVR